MRVITKGLSVGEIIVTDGVQKIRSGMKVKPVFKTDDVHF